MAEAIGIRLDSMQIARLLQFESLLLDWNQRMNLTAITDPAEIEVKHFLDSLTVLPTLTTRLTTGVATLVDVGAGAGFPGLVLAIAEPSLHVTLLEATAKKVRFMQAVIDQLQLQNANALQGRAEEI